MSNSKQHYAVLGAGSWGTALALQLARAGHPTLLWSHSEDHCREMLRTQRNDKYLPGMTFPENLHPVHDLQTTIDQVRDILVVVPSHVFRETVQRLKPFLNEQHRLAWGTKGLEPGTRKLLHQIVREELGITVPVAAVSGPTFAMEVAKGLPGAITVASKDTQFANDLAEALHSEYFLTYTSDDIIGVEIGGAAKNVMAIAAGIADGLGFGANTRSAVITRGLAEIIRLGTAMGGRQDTFMGLTGLGDLVLTCTDDQSRNRRFGLSLARGKSEQEARRDIGQVIEGIRTADVTLQLARRHGVEMPISEHVHRVIRGEMAAREAVQSLLARERKSEAAD